MFSAPVILLLDEQIERLQQARAILATLVPRSVREVVPVRPAVRARRAGVVAVPVERPVQVEQVVEELPPASKPPRKVRVRRQKREVREVPAAVAPARALGGSIPDRPVVIFAKALAKPERAPVVERQQVVEDRTGTLEALVRELTERRGTPLGSMVS